MNVIGSIDGSSKTDPGEIGPNEHGCCGKMNIGKVSID